MAEWKQKRVFLFSHPRTASNLVTRILSAQLDWDVAGYCFFDAFLYSQKNFAGKELETIPESLWEKHASLIEAGHKKMVEFFEQSLERKKHALLKEHSQMIAPAKSCYWGDPDGTSDSPNRNPTILSDSLMLSWHPVVLIRNPILVYPSWLRAMGTPYLDLDSNFARATTTLRHQRRIVDWYRSQSDACPVVVLDADDVIERPEVMKKLCDITGMNRDELMFEWAPASNLAADWEPQPDKAKAAEVEQFKRFTSTISASSSILSHKTSAGISLDGKEKEWVQEFGQDIAAALRLRVVESWPDYEYLRSLRLS